MQVTEAEPSLFSCAFAGSAFYRKVREEPRGNEVLWTGEFTALPAFEAGPPSSGLLQGTPQSRAPPVTGLWEAMLMRTAPLAGW